MIYTVAAVVSYKEGQEFSACSDESNLSKKVAKDPVWKVRIEKKIQLLRKEADILKAHLDSRVSRGETVAFLNCVMRKYQVDGSKDGVTACLFKIKNKISAMACKIKSYELKRKAKEQNDLFWKDKK